MAQQAESTGIPSGESISPRLDERESRILAFEHQWRHAGAKEEAIRAEFGLSAARYYQLLNALLDSPDALAADPMLVKRLRRLRDARASARSSRVLGDVITPNDRGY